MGKLIFLCLMTASFFAGVQALAHQGATGIVKERMDAFKASQRQLKSIIAAAKTDDFEQVEKLASQLAEWGRVMPEYFPADSASPPSEAAPAIWQDFSGFQAAANRFTLASEKLAKAGAEEDKERIFTAIEAVAGSCKSCHSAYRLK
jgi:cytochrome c556